MRNAKRGIKTDESANLNTMITAASPGWFDSLEPKSESRRLEEKDDKEVIDYNAYPINFSKLCTDRNLFQIGFVDVAETPPKQQITMSERKDGQPDNEFYFENLQTVTKVTVQTTSNCFSDDKSLDALKNAKLEVYTDS
jgi:hypothetical protein